jgi:hypothetical protein
MVALMKLPLEASTESSIEPWAERRNFPRQQKHAVATGHRMDHTLEARRDPRLYLNMRDISLGGLSAICDRPLKEGERLTVVFPRKGLNAGWDAFGRVLRCEQSALGYRVAVEFDRMLAA